MRRIFNLDKVEVEPCTMLLHGDYNSFKTYLLGSMLSCESKHPDMSDVVFLNIQGEDGTKTLANFPDLLIKNKRVWTLEDYKDVKDVLNELEAKPVRAVAIDSAKVMATLIFQNELGEDRPPNLPKAGEKDAVNEWPGVHWASMRFYQRIRKLGTIVGVACPSDLAAPKMEQGGTSYWKKKQLSQLTIAPDMPGKQAQDCAGWFDYVGYCDTKILGPKEVRRELHFELTDEFKTRARLVRPITGPIVIPAGPKAWLTVRAELEKHLVIGGK